VLFLSLRLIQAGAPAGPPDVPPCAACLVWEVTTPQAEEVLAANAMLDGIEVLLRPAAGGGDAETVLRALAARGARAGLIVTGVETLPRGAGAAGRVLIDLRDVQDEDVDRLAFELKTLATAIRGASPSAEIGIEAGPDRWESLDKRGMGPYLDFRVGPSTLGEASPVGGLPVWVRREPGGFVERYDRPRVVVRAPDDAARAILATRAQGELVEVVGERTLTVEEIVARHQAAAARQRTAVRRAIATGSLVVTFEAPGLAAPMTLTSDVVVYDDGGQREMEQRSLRLNGVEYGDASGVPRLPLLEPERVTSPPLAIALDAAYRYRLEGRETVDGQDCYVVGFEPASPGRPLFRGRAWIAARSFAMARTETVQTALRGPIVSSRQRDEFTAVPVADGVAWLPARSEVHQVYEGPGHRTPIDRVLTLARWEVDPEDFAARRAAAHASTSVIVADTPAGLRYLRRAPPTNAAAEPRRETLGTASSVRTMAMGVLVDPNIGRPLPFAGVSYVDFDFLRTGAQVNGFFGGVFASLSWTLPSLGGSRWQAHGSGFAVLASYNDRAFSGGVERYEENLRQKPARLALGVARPLWGQTRLRLGYEVDYTRLGRADTTAAEFVVPVSPLVHGIRVGLEAHGGPWSAEAWWNGAVRQRWEAWGFSGSEPGGAAFQRFGASAARSFVLSPRAVARVDAAWMGGRGLDRFSRYGFDGFQNTLRGYPTATVRYDHGGVVRGALTCNAARKVRLDGFLDAARVRDPGIDPRSRTYVGVGAGLEAPLPLRALASVEWGYGFQARGRSGQHGAHVVRVTAYKVF
jgi:hypothetical protein